MTWQVFPHLLKLASYTIIYPAADIVRSPGTFLGYLRNRSLDRAWLQAKRQNLSVARSRFAYAYGVDATGSAAPRQEQEAHAPPEALPNPLQVHPDARFGGGLRGALEELLLFNETTERPLEL